MPTTVAITACDNELYVIAFNGNESYLVCRVMSGYYNSVNISMTINQGAYAGPVIISSTNQPVTSTFSTQVPAGSYSLLLIGVDWGVSANFAVNVNGNPVSYAPIPSLPSPGTVWAPAPVSITI